MNRKALPSIRIDEDEKRVCSEAIASLAAVPNVYQRGCFLVDVVQNARPGALLGRPTIRALPTPTLREHLASAAIFLRLDRRSQLWVTTHVPDWVVRGVERRGKWPAIPPLEGVLEHPVLRPDGSALTTAGYDPATGLLFVPRAEFPPVPEAPTQADAKRAVAQILEYVREFPFATPADRSAWLTIPLTLLARPAIDGCTPLVFIDANTPGTGKTLLAEIGVAMVTGRRQPRMSKPETDDELRKQITSLALSGESVALLDNVKGTLAFPSLDAALTSQEWSDRTLGENRQVRLPLSLMWLVTGNNATLGGDLVRRSLHVRLETLEERPEERSGWRFLLPNEVLKNSPALVCAGLTILRAYCLAGMPSADLPELGSFTAWNQLIRGAILWLGLPDPVETRNRLAMDSDSTIGAMHTLLEALEPHALHPRRITAVELCRRAGDDPELAAALEELIEEKLSSRSVGRLFRQMRGRVFGARTLVPHAERRTAAGRLWTVQMVCPGEQSL